MIASAAVKDFLLIGSDPSSDVALPSTAPRHARLVRQGAQVLIVADAPIYVNGQPVPLGQAIPFDPRVAYFLGQVQLPTNHPTIVAFVTGQSQLVQGPQGQAHGGPMAGGPPAGGPGAPPGGDGGAPGPRKHRTVIGELSLDQLQSTAITIGRTPENKIVVQHPQVSSRHAQIHKQGDELFLEDLRSANGTFVRGQRLNPGQRVPISNGEKILIGPMPVIIQIAGAQINVVVEDQQASWAGKPLYEIEAWDLTIEVPDRDNKGAVKTLLDRVSFKAMPGDMIALMGPSGAGKTTLLMTLNGYMPPSSGQVRVNGEDLYAIYDALRGSIGYVPQDDIVHPELTVFEAVRYSARFRLPPDYSDEEIDARVEQTLRDLGLEGVKNLQIGKPEKKVLSGGQRKRVNIALELVTDPVIVFLDEPTSGLAADDTTALISLLSDLVKRTGKTIIMTIHQPAKDEFEKFNLAFIMGYGGIPTYFGPAGEDAYRFFSSLVDRPNSPYRALAPNHKRIDNPRDMFDMLNIRERATLDEMKRHDPNVTRNTSRLEAAKQWRGEFFNQSNPVFQKMYSGPRAVGTGSKTNGVAGRADVPLFKQLALLVSRYWKVKTRDRAGAAIMFLQAPVIGILLAMTFGGQKPSIPFWCLGALNELSKKAPDTTSATKDLMNSMQITGDHTVAMFFVVVSCVWFGTSNAAREIVTERAIYLRERMVNLSLFNYVMSKYIILSLVCVVQCAMLLGIVFFSLGFEGGVQSFFLELLVMVAVSMNAAALGLLLSSVVASAEAAMALTPIALIPQVVLGGLMVPMTTNPMLKPLMYVMPARWGFQGSIAEERAAIQNAPAWVIDLHRPELTSAPDFIYAGRFHCAVAQIGSDSIPGAWGFSDWTLTWLPHAVLYGMTGVMMAILFVLLRRRDPV